MEKNAKKGNKRKHSYNSFVLKYKWWFISALLLFTVIYVVIYFLFCGKGYISAGIDLRKSDWLSFLGEYLSLVGTVLISLVAVLQAKFFTDRDESKSKQDRINRIKPILSINIVGKDTLVNGTAEAISLNDTSKNPHHKNISFSLENVGEYPISNVIVFDNYLYPMLKPNDKKNIQIAYSDSPDLPKWKNHLIELTETEFERTDEGLPKSIVINYDDIDGNEMYQIFALSSFDDIQYYSLTGTHHT